MRSLRDRLNRSSEPPKAAVKTPPKDLRDEFIERVVAGRSFCDVGGLWGTVKEKVSVASAAGASSVAMFDITPQGAKLWNRFDERMAELGIDDVSRISGNVDDPALPSLAGPFDVVHCSGVVYHCPNPLHTIAQLGRIATEHLVFTSIVIPERIEVPAGAFEAPPGHAVFIPGLGDRDREILKQHFEQLGIKPVGISTHVETWSTEDYAPWWWLTSAATMRMQIVAAGWRVVDDGEIWRGRSHGYLAEKRRPS